MTTFVDDNQEQDSVAELHNDAFYPELSLTDLYKKYRKNDHVSDHIAIQQLQEAIYEINIQLTEWRKTHTEATLREIGESYAWSYTNAVYTQAKAYLIRIYRDDSATGIGHDRADGNDLSAENYERKSWQSLQRIFDAPSSRVTLL
jgi:hypothetical protein